MLVLANIPLFATEVICVCSAPALAKRLFTEEFNSLVIYDFNIAPLDFNVVKVPTTLSTTGSKVASVTAVILSSSLILIVIMIPQSIGFYRLR